MKTVEVNTDRSYNIYIERGIIKSAGKYIQGVSKAVRAAVISDSEFSSVSPSIS